MKTTKYIRHGVQNILVFFKRRDYKFILRLFLNYIWAFFKIPFMVPRPLELQLEPSLGCNLKCKMCNINQIAKKGKITFMAKENFNFLLNQILPMKAINFTGMGESLLNKDLENFISKANSANIETLFITNGQLLTPQRVNKIIFSNVNKICISMESGDPVTYEAIRRGAIFSKLKENVRNLIQKIKELNTETEVLINVVLLKQNIEDVRNIYKIIDFARQCGIFNITFQNLHDVFACQTFIYFSKKKNFLKKNLQLIKSYADKNRVNVFLPAIDVREGSCYYPWIYPQITASGELLPCCIIPQFGDYSELIEKYSFGNVFAENFGKVWNSKKAKAFRRSLSQKKPNEYCQRCSKYLGIL